MKKKRLLGGKGQKTIVCGECEGRERENVLREEQGEDLFELYRSLYKKQDRNVGRRSFDEIGLELDFVTSSFRKFDISGGCIEILIGLVPVSLDDVIQNFADIDL